MDALKIGFVCHPTRSNVEALEALPIDSLWAGGHIASRNPTPEAVVQLARLSALTERVRIGTSILLLPLYAPAIVAKQVADIDRATGGRVTLGVGIGGEYPGEFRACQVPIAERGRRTDEAIGLLRELWQGEEFSHSGRFYSMEDVRIQPTPAQQGGPPIVVAGRQEPAMRRAALLGDGWMPYLYSPRRYAESVRKITAFAEQAGRDLSRFEWMAFLFTNVNEDGDRAREEAAQSLGGTYNQDFRQMLDNVAVAGTPAEVEGRLREYVAAGVRHLIFSLASRGENREMAVRLVHEIVPRLVAA